MTINEILEKYEKIQENNLISFIREDDYIDVIKKSKAPKKFGVYLFLEKPEVETNNILYIGKSGTVEQDGKWKKQTIRKRLTKNQNGEKRKLVLPKLMKIGKDNQEIKKIFIRCFVTYDKENGFEDLPGYVEGLLMNEYFKKEKKLPIWNRYY